MLYTITSLYFYMTRPGITIQPTYKQNATQGERLYTPKNIIIIILIQTLPTRNLGRLPHKRRIIEPHIQQPNLQPIITDQINKFVRLGCDGLLIQQHQQSVQPFRGDAVALWPKCQQRDFALCCSAAGACVSGFFVGVCTWGFGAG